MSETILIDTPEEGVRRLTLNRPDTLNAFSWEMYEALLDAFAAIRSDTAVRVVILTGAGRGFCSGHDLRNAGTSPYVPEGAGKLFGKG